MSNPTKLEISSAFLIRVNLKGERISQKRHRDDRAAGKILTCNSNEEGNSGRTQKNPNQDVFELFDDSFPNTFLLLLVKLVCTVLNESLFYLLS